MKTISPILLALALAGGGAHAFAQESQGQATQTPQTNPRVQPQQNGQTQSAVERQRALRQQQVRQQRLQNGTVRQNPNGRLNDAPRVRPEPGVNQRRADSAPPQVRRGPRTGISTFNNRANLTQVAPDPIGAFNRLDADGNGVLTQEEFSADPRFQQRNNRRQNLSPSSLSQQRLRERQRFYQQLFVEHDQNGDRKLSRAELPATLWGQVADADANQDGLVTLQEINQNARQEARQPLNTPQRRGNQ